ncbi:MAG: UbiA prenyltransferase family protein [Deltaproteobacteria bacterium]|nr:UbiA prenyltransferase family protein [Deltaproteobacteria bacterium]
MIIGDYIELSRPKHWVKNGFVFMPVPFALAAGAHLDPLAFALGLISFCIGTSAVYSFNDAKDAERDRAHDTKRNRPVASGRISKRGAYLWALFLAAIGVILALETGRIGTLIILSVYLCVNLFYSFGGKNVPLLDVFLLSAGFILRVLLGCVLLGVQASNWLLLCSYTLALFVALAKRRADVIKGLDGAHRPSLLGYNQSFLDQAMGITASMTIIAYALYSIEAVVLIPHREFAALPFVAFAVLDYLRMAHVNKAGGSPVDTFLGSPALLISGVGYLVATLWSVKLP